VVPPVGGNGPQASPSASTALRGDDRLWLFHRPDSFQQILRGTQTLDPAVQGAIAVTVQLGESVLTLQQERGEKFEAIRVSLEPLQARVDDVARASQSPPSPFVAMAALGVSTVLLAALVEATDYPYVRIPYCMHYGFEVCGRIPDSGVFRQVDPNMTSAEFDKVYEEVMDPAANLAWVNDLVHELRDDAESASGTRQTQLATLEALTAKEISKGLVGQPMTLEQLLAQYGLSDAQGHAVGVQCLVMRQFLLLQPKPQAVDDAKTSLSNHAKRTYKTVSLPTPEHPALVSAEFLRVAGEAGIAPFPLCLGSEDEDTAFRRVPTAQPEMTVVALYSPEQGEVVFHQVFGYNFGLVSSVLNFNRVSCFVSWVTASIFAVPLTNYFDDFIITDIEAAGSSGQDALRVVHDITGLMLLADPFVLPSLFLLHPPPSVPHKRNTFEKPSFAPLLVTHAAPKCS